MAGTSTYLQYLPPVLWKDEPAPPEFSLGAMLRIFEKLLTGIEDGIAIEHGDHRHEAIAAIISHLHRLYDPWATPAQFMDSTSLKRTVISTSWMGTTVTFEALSNSTTYSRGE